MDESNNNRGNMGFAGTMGPKLRAFVEQQLLQDLTHYGVTGKDLHLDWSNSCVEGHRTNFLDGSLENFSGITVLNEKGDAIAEGWMDFIEDTAASNLIVFWDYVSVFDAGKLVAEKGTPGIPDHTWERLPGHLKQQHTSNRVSNRMNLP